MRREPLELLTPAELARADAAAVAMGVPVALLMARAGWAVARAVAARFQPCPTLVLCGPGNNGGDGRVAAALLARRGWPVSVAAGADPRAAGRAGLVIDALFGAGLSRPLDARAAAALGAARRLVAVDVPSGLDGATGQPLGPVAPAALTVTFFRRKPGHLLLPGRALCGELVLADIGLPAAVLDEMRPATFANGPGLWRVPVPDAASHKYTRGHVTVLGGDMAGAAMLAAAAARRGGAGLVSQAPPDPACFVAADPGVIVTDAALPALLADGRRRVWVCGPGLGAEAARRALPALLAAGRRVVADADALFDAGALRGVAVLTPHLGEFARVFGPPGPDRLAAVRAAAAGTGAVVLLKGADTIIAAPDGRAAINAHAPPWLATAGAGDVLAGLIGGLLAQGMDDWDAACAAAWLHGEAGFRAGPGLLAEDLPRLLPSAIAQSQSG